MARKQVKDVTVLQTWNDVDGAMQKIITAENVITSLNSELDVIVAAAKENAALRAAPHADAIKLLEVQIKQFVSTHEKELDGKSKKLNFGETGFRKSTRCTVPKGKEGDVLAKLKEFGWLDCIKTSEAVLKENLKKRPVTAVLETGAYLKTEEKFWYEVHHEELEEN